MDGAVFSVAVVLLGYLIGRMQGVKSGRHQEGLKRADIAATAMDYMRAANVPAAACNKIFNYLLTGTAPEAPEIKPGKTRQPPTLDVTP